MSDTSHDHGGTCAFCGSTVDRNYTTCTGCGATWRNVLKGRGGLVVTAAVPVGLFAGIFVGVAMLNFGVFVVATVGTIVAMFAWGLSMRTAVWVRQ